MAATRSGGRTGEVAHRAPVFLLLGTMLAKRLGKRPPKVGRVTTSLYRATLTPPVRRS